MQVTSASTGTINLRHRLLEDVVQNAEPEVDVVREEERQTRAQSRAIQHGHSLLRGVLDVGPGNRLEELGVALAAPDVVREDIV